MNLGSMKYISVGGRRTGKTTALCKAAKEIGALVIVHNAEEGKRLEEQYGVKTKTIGDSLQGLSMPVLFDTHAVHILVCEFVYERDRLKDEIAALHEKLFTIKSALGGA